MNKFDELYTFYIATTKDRYDIMEFIGKNWKKDHILANDVKIFDYLHKFKDRINFFIARSKKSGNIEALEGFIQYSYILKDIGPVMWSVDKKSQIPMLGLELSKRSKENIGYSFMGGPGVNMKTSGVLHKMKGFVTGKMKQFYILNKKSNYNIAKINLAPKTKLFKCKQLKFIKVNKFEDLNYDFDKIERVPYKDNWFIKRRYFDHPVYKYLVYKIIGNDKTVAVIIFKEVKINGSRILRIIDFFGCPEHIVSINKHLQELVKEYEYIDFYIYGIDDEILLKSGFVLNDGKNIFPDYFSPFLQKNIDVFYAASNKDCIVVKGDADQDRPS